MKLFWDDKLPEKSGFYKRQERFYLISVIYSQLKVNKALNLNEIFQKEVNMTSKEFEKVKEIVNNLPWIVSLIKFKLKNKFEWDAMYPLTKAILIYGTYEMCKIDAPLAIFEAVQISKYLIRKEETNMVNAILDKIMRILTEENIAKNFKSLSDSK